MLLLTPSVDNLYEQPNLADFVARLREHHHHQGGDGGVDCPDIGNQCKLEGNNLVKRP